jgi:hypothetical protein
MWTVSGLEVSALRGGAGEKFTAFANSVIRAEASRCGIPQLDISTNLRTTIPDGGIDTEVRTGVPRCEYLDVPTCWQFKATAAAAIGESDLHEEINKGYSRDLITKGYRYCFCIADEISPEKRTRWEEFLYSEAQDISAAASHPKVFSADQLAAWAGRFPAVVIRFFRPTFDPCLDVDAWGQSITTLTPHYVTREDSAQLFSAIQQHANLSYQSSSAGFALQGGAGVGKTRLVYEALHSLAGAADMVVYTIDERTALQLATALANDNTLSALLVADECSPKSRMRIDEILLGHRHRIRVFTIDNMGERPSTGAPEFFLDRVPDLAVRSILAENYSHVPEERRIAYADLSKGFVRFAIQLCREDGQISTAGHFRAGLPGIRDYIKCRLTSDELQVLEAIALFRRVGYRDDVREELEGLCQILHLEQHVTIEIARRLKDGPGYVQMGGRYLYVSSEIVSQIAFEGGWQRFAAANVTSFLNSIPAGLLQDFLQRVKTAPPEIRREVSGFFRGRTLLLTPDDLQEITSIQVLEALVEADPEVYFPLLIKLIASASPQLLTKLPIQGSGGWGPRRHLVWHLERMAALPEYFYDSEMGLLKLALAESEPNLANNATEIWKQLFRIFLSGTAMPFPARIEVLKKRLSSGNVEEASLALRALEGVFHRFSSRMVGPTLVAGRLRPEDWRPRTIKEQQECTKLALETLLMTVRSDSPVLADEGTDILLQHLRSVLAGGHLNELVDLFQTRPVSEVKLATLIEAVEEFLRFECAEAAGPHKPPEAYIAKVKQWLSSILPDTFRGKLVSLIGKSPWHHSMLGDEDRWRAEIRVLADALLEKSELLQEHIDWLSSEQAKSAFVFGQLLGELDVGGACLELTITTAERTGVPTLASGYVRGLLESHPMLSGQVNDRLDSLETSSPGITYAIAFAGGEGARSLDRTLRLVDKGQLPIGHLRAFAFGYGGRALAVRELREILLRLVGPVEKGDTQAGTVAIEVITHRYQVLPQQHVLDLLADSNLQDAFWRILTTISALGQAEPHWWGVALRIAEKMDPTRSARIAVSALAGERFFQQREALWFLSEIAPVRPKEVMELLGELMLDDEKRVSFYFSNARPLFEVLPLDVVRGWLETVGVKGARRIVRHLPPPRLDKDGQPIVPPLTEFVLSEFGKDEATFGEFCAGVHSGQMYHGDIAAAHEKEAEIAKRFLDHPNQRVRDWARYEIELSERMATRMRQREEEFNIE